MFKSLDDFTTLTAAARKIGVTVSTLRMWVDIGRMRAVRDDSGRRLLLREDVERIAEERKRVGAVHPAPHSKVK
jgi:excisionase family DNA binding protein